MWKCGDVEMWRCEDVAMWKGHISTLPHSHIPKSLRQVLVDRRPFDPPGRADLLAGELARIEDGLDVGFGDAEHLRRVGDRQQFGRARDGALHAARGRRLGDAL